MEEGPALQKFYIRQLCQKVNEKISPQLKNKWIETIDRVESQENTTTKQYPLTYTILCYDQPCEECSKVIEKFQFCILCRDIIQKFKWIEQNENPTDCFHMACMRTSTKPSRFIHLLYIGTDDKIIPFLIKETGKVNDEQNNIGIQNNETDQDYQPEQDILSIQDNSIFQTEFHDCLYRLSQGQNVDAREFFVFESEIQCDQNGYLVTHTREGVSVTQVNNSQDEHGVVSGQTTQEYTNPVNQDDQIQQYDPNSNTTEIGGELYNSEQEMDQEQ